MQVTQKTLRYQTESQKAIDNSNATIESHSLCLEARANLITGVAQFRNSENLQNLVLVEKFTDNIYRQILYNGIDNRINRIDDVQQAILLIKKMIDLEISNLKNASDKTKELVRKSLESQTAKFVKSLTTFKDTILTDEGMFARFILRALFTTPSTEKTEKTENSSPKPELTEAEILAAYGLAENE